MDVHVPVFCLQLSFNAPTGETSEKVKQQKPPTLNACTVGTDTECRRVSLSQSKSL